MRRHERHEHVVDESYYQLVGDRIAGDQQPVPQHALAQLAGDLDGSIRAHIAAGDASRQRTTDTANVRYTAAPRYRRRVTIDHRPLADVTPGMLLDWFTHLGATMSYGGVVIDRYLAWHPIDHIRWELARPAPGGGAAEGARFRIVEVFGGRPEFKVDVVDRVEKLDETGIRLVQRIAGVVVFQLEHTWSAGSEGVHYVSVMDIGARSPLLAAVNRVACRRFPDEMVHAWVRHNIEEVGQLEYLLPRLNSSGEAEPTQSA